MAFPEFPKVVCAITTVVFSYTTVKFPLTGSSVAVKLLPLASRAEAIGLSGPTRTDGMAAVRLTVFRSATTFEEMLLVMPMFMPVGMAVATGAVAPAAVVPGAVAPAAVAPGAVALLPAVRDEGSATAAAGGEVLPGTVALASAGGDVAVTAAAGVEVLSVGGEFWSEAAADSSTEPSGFDGVVPGEALGVAGMSCRRRRPEVEIFL